MSMNLRIIPNKGALIIPSAVLDLAGLGGEEQMELHFDKGVLAVLKRNLTARDMIETITGLHEIAADLIRQLALASGNAEEVENSNGCEKKCDYAATCDLSIPPCILAEAGIPLNLPLLAYVEDGTIVIKGEEQDSLEDEIPGDLLQALMNGGVNTEGLSTLLKGDRIIYGE